MKIKFYLFYILTFLYSIAYAQGQVVKGKIVDAQNEFLTGANVWIEGSFNGTVSDLDGNFELKAAIGQNIMVSFLGFETVKKQVTSDFFGQELTITLLPAENQLSEVVVTGALGIKRASRELGGGSQTVTNEYLNQGKTVNPLTGLTSKVAGLRINMFDSKVDPQIQIIMRGSRSLNRSKNAPIYVVDGIPVPEIGRINPNDIENITVLKGANAAALYGSEGVNGALMITTKTGSKDRGRINFSNTNTFSNVFLLPPAQNQFGQGVNGVYNPTQFESWGPAFDGTMKPIGGTLPDGTTSQILYTSPARDNRLDLFQTGLNLQNDLSFSGGDQKSTYFFSLQDVRINGIIPEDVSSRTGARLNGTRVFGNLKTSYNVNYTNFNSETTPDGPWITSYQLPANLEYAQLVEWKDPNSMANPLHFFTDLQKNPYHQIDNYRNKLQQQTLNGKVEFEFPLTSWLSITERAGLYSRTDQTRNTVGKFEASGRRNINGSVSDGSNNFRRFNNDVILTAEKTFDHFTTRLIAGQNVRIDDTKSTTLSSSNLTLPELFNPSSRIGELGGSSNIIQYRSLASYAEFTGGYKNFLFLTLTGRNEWVSVLSKENRSYFYPGVSTSLIFTDALPSIKENSVINYGKLFASFNKTGNVTLDPYSLNNPYSQINGFPFGNLVGFTPSSRYPNPDIQPEFVRSFEIGTQVSMFDNRLNFEGSYIFSDSKGQIFNATTSRATGYASALVNAGRLTNSIVELTVNSDLIRNKSVQWNLGFAFTHVNNQVKELYAGLTSFNIFRQSYANIGQAYPSLLVSDYQRDPNGRVVINEHTGEPLIAADPVHLGTMVPPFQMGINNNISFKGISLAAQFDWRMGGWLYTEIVPRMYTAGTDPRTVEFNREPFIYPNSVIKDAEGNFVENTSVLSKGDRAYWTKQGDVQINTAAKSDYFKLRELNLTYALPKHVLGNQNVVKEASIAFVATNLFIIRHKDNNYGDPEYLYNTTDGYISFRQVPPFRTYGFNINVGF
jgi:TonB-linked SusC/RagA family outer membrane protein